MGFHNLPVACNKTEIISQQFICGFCVFNHPKRKKDEWVADIDNILCSGPNMWLRTKILNERLRLKSKTEHGPQILDKKISMDRFFFYAYNEIAFIVVWTQCLWI